jgi:hypothetical protein
MKMKMKQILILAAAMLIATGTVCAQESASLFESPGKKQTAKDFKPAPAEIKTDFGELKFLHGAFPTEESAQKIYDEMDLQRATQAYMDFYPALSLYAIVSSQARDFGFKNSSDFGVIGFMKPSENYLTGNDVTVYAVASLDLKQDGPTVVEAPPGMLGTVDDALFKYVTGFGAVGPDKGKGGKFLFLPPGHKGDVPDGYYKIESPSYRLWCMMRGFGEVGTGDQAVAWFQKHLKIYPLATGPRGGTAIKVSGMGINCVPPEDGSVFEMLNKIIQYEPVELFNPEQLGRLATLGIEKGKPFKPDVRMKKIFNQAAKQGVAMCRAIVYSSRDPEVYYWPNRRWEKMFVRNTEFVRNDFSDIDARTLWHYQAIVVAPHLIPTTPGVGTMYLTSFRDKNGKFLSGDRNYRFLVPADPPVKRFWAVTAYDPTSRSLLDSGGNITVSSLGEPKVNSGGSVDVFLGPTKPKAVSEKNWIKTDPKKGFFLVFRFYGPLERIMDKTWVLNDIEPVR